MGIFLKESDQSLHFDRERETIFDQMSSNWDVEVSEERDQHISELLENAGVKGKTILDIGAGTGVLIDKGLVHSPDQWIACDLSSEMLKILNQKYQNQPALRTLHADVHQLPIQSHAIDVVICHNAFPHFHSPKAALTELYRVLKPGGMLIIDHSLGREKINNIHENAESKLLQQDLLEPTDQVKKWLEEIGYTVKKAVETKQMYRVISRR